MKGTWLSCWKLKHEPRKKRGVVVKIPDRVLDDAAGGRMDLKVEREVGDDSEWPQGNPAPGGVAPEALGAAAGRDDAGKA